MDKAKKKLLKRYIAWISLVALTALLAVMPLLARQEEEADGPVASILSATVQEGSVEAALHGGGTLSAGNVMDITIPAGVKIESFLVKNGDTVTKGTPVALVDTVSLMNAIVSVQESMDYLQKQIVAAGDDTVGNTISATAGGHIKEVYAQQGDSVQDVMIRHGALAVLSLDGRMAVRIERKTALAAGDTVCVTLADGTEISGRVESSLDGTVIVSMEDKDYPIGENVTVTTDDGDRVGSGELYVHNAWKATAFTGTVQTVYAREDTDVHSGATLFTLTDTDFSGHLESLASLHREYEELLQEMFQMYESGCITAPCDGVVSGVDSDSPWLLSAAQAEQEWFPEPLSREEEKGWTVMLLSGSTPAVCDGTAKEANICTAKAGTHISGCYYYCTGQVNCTAKPGEHTNCLSQCKSSRIVGECGNSVHKKDCIDGCISSDGNTVCSSEIHRSDCIESCESSDGKADCPATKHHKTDCVEACTKAADCPAAPNHYETCLTHCDESENCAALHHKETCYMASLIFKGKASWIQQVGIDGLVVKQDTVTTYQFTTGPSGLQLIYPTSLNTSTLIEENTIKLNNPSQYSKGDVILQWDAYQNGTWVKSGVTVYTNLPVKSSGSMGGMGFGGFSFFGGMAGGSSGLSMDTLFSLDGNVLMTVTEQEVMTLTVTLDEHDIRKVSIGQSAVVEVAALKGQSFDAEITDIGTFGTSNGGSSKFTAELTIPMEQDMLAGMNATAVIPLYTKMEVLTIPAAALVETVDGTCVYTALDPETGEPASQVSVTTGISDGTTVEILSGLKKGDTIYYSYYDTLELDHTAKTELDFSFG